MTMIQYPAVFILLLVLCFSARKNYTWVIASALVIACGVRVIHVFDFPAAWEEFFIGQLTAAILMISGHLLCNADAQAFRLFLRARLHGTSDFSRAELVKLLGFSSLAKRTVINVSMIICLITAGAAMVVSLIESGGSTVSSQMSLLDETIPPGYGALDPDEINLLSGEIAADSVANAEFLSSGNVPRERFLGFPGVLLPVFLPLIVGLIVAQFMLWEQDASWFSALTPADLRREPGQLPSHLWLFPALSVLLAWSERIFAYLAAF
ncbi:MAG TPA: hypothetical protein DCG57_09860 [Candidatus Riflebacteria bacterium]|nr:hypothetical protein [Candidatus Riflebacteria bacterium]